MINNNKQRTSKKEHTYMTSTMNAMAKLDNLTEEDGKTERKK